MTLAWVREVNPRWDSDKQRIIGHTPDAFQLPFHGGDLLVGEWWYVAEQVEGFTERTLAYGRLDITWGGDAEILVAVDPERHEQGIGTFVLTKLEEEARARGVNYVYNTIRDHAGRDLVHDWLVVRGFRGAVDGDLRKRVGTPITPVRVAGRSPEPYDPKADVGGLGPGDEVQGAYVNVEDHRF